VGTDDRWRLVERLLPGVERPSRYIDGEWGARHASDAEYHVALVYPDTYEIGQANQAISILYEILNGQPGVCAERAYVPWVDMADAMRADGVELVSLESSTPLWHFDLLGITLPHELSYTNILETLDLAGIPFHATGRAETDPLVIGGGPCAYNPEPVASFFDAILVGEGEDAVVEIVQVHRACMREGRSRRETLVALSRVPGVYVPSLFQAADVESRIVVTDDDIEPGEQTRILKRVVSDLSDYRAPTCPVVPFTEVVHDRFTVEVTRGCTRGCRFCQAGMVYRPVRERSADDIVRHVIAGLACTGYDEVSLTSLSSTDYSLIEDVLRRLARRLEGTGISVSLPSLRVDAFGVEMARLVSRGRKSGLTFAPEAGTQRLRDVINKNVTEEDLIGSVTRACESGWRRVKLYFMIGLPTETDEDVRAIGSLVARVLEAARHAVNPKDRGSLRVAVSVSTFVPKAHTPFQWEAQTPLEEVRRRQALLREAMPKKGVELSWHDPEVSFLEGVMARGGRELAAAVETAWAQGRRFDAWTERFDLASWMRAFEATGVDSRSIANREREAGERLPWSHLSSGVSAAYLASERRRALEGLTTADCSFVGCTGCDACDELGVEIVIAGGARGQR